MKSLQFLLLLFQLNGNNLQNVIEGQELKSVLEYNPKNANPDIIFRIQRKELRIKIYWKKMVIIQMEYLHISSLNDSNNRSFDFLIENNLFEKILITVKGKENLDMSLLILSSKTV